MAFKAEVKTAQANYLVWFFFSRSSLKLENFWLTFKVHNCSVSKSPLHHRLLFWHMLQQNSIQDSEFKKKKNFLERQEY